MYPAVRYAPRTPAQTSVSETNTDLYGEPGVAAHMPEVNMGSSIVTAMPVMVNKVRHVQCYALTAPHAVHGTLAKRVNLVFISLLAQINLQHPLTFVLIVTHFSCFDVVQLLHAAFGWQGGSTPSICLVW